MGLSKDEVAKQVAGWRANEAAAQAKILKSKAFNWQLLNCDYKPNATHTCANSPQVAPGREQNASAAKAQCTAWMRDWVSSKRSFVRFCNVHAIMTILPRQARDRHRENSKQNTV